MTYRASPELIAYILSVAPPHFATPDAPGTYKQLRAVRGLSPMPVYGGHCDRTIYSAPQVNYAFRAWHDSLHLKLKAKFDEAGELAVAREHERLAREAGLSELDVCALFFDTWGQFRYSQEHAGQFPTDQAAFVAACFRDGMSAAILQNH